MAAKKPCILIVADDATTRRALVILSESLDFYVIEAQSLAEGRERLAEHPDAIIVDLLLPNDLAMEFLRAVRSSGSHIALAVISRADDAMLSEAASLHPALFGKPIIIDEIYAWLREIRRRRPDTRSHGREGKYWS